MKIVRYVADKCAASTYTNALGEAGVTVIDFISADRNTTVEFYLNGRNIPLRAGAIFNDFLALAVSVYIADLIHLRNRGSDGWSRSFKLTVPVSSPALWKAHDSLLSELLTFLSGDSFRFTWPKRRSSENRASDQGAAGREETFDAVCLFSGGFDSFLGAEQLLASGRRVLLVGHYAEGQTSSAQTRVHAALQALYHDKVAFLQCRVATSLVAQPHFSFPEAEREPSHRTRSFLFIALALSAAQVVGASEIYIPENGLISLNAPLGISRLGTFSTRTAHPKYLIFYQHLIDSLTSGAIRVKNPFIFQSKTDMAQAFGIRQQVKRVFPLTLSCSKASVIRWHKRGDVWHCGKCVPCLYRRIAFESIGLDNASAYLYDVFSQLDSMPRGASADTRFLIRFAKSVLDTTERGRMAMVTSQGHFPPAELGQIAPKSVSNYSEWAAMLERWAQGTLDMFKRAASPAARAVLDL